MTLISILQYIKQFKFLLKVCKGMPQKHTDISARIVSRESARLEGKLPEWNLSYNSNAEPAWFKRDIPFLHSLQEKGCKTICKKEFECTYYKEVFQFFFQCFWLVYAFYGKWQLALFILSGFPGIRNLSGFNELNSLNNLSDLYSLISSKYLLILIFPSALSPKWLILVC